MVKMKFKTHEEIDEHYAKQGLDIPKLHKEFNQVKGILGNEEKRAIYFLRKKMGKIKFALWKLSCFPLWASLSYGLGKNGFIEKAKEYGFKDNIDFAVKEVMNQN